MQQELIEMLEEIIQYVEVWNAHDQGIIDKAEALIKKAKNTAPAVPQGGSAVTDRLKRGLFKHLCNSGVLLEWNSFSWGFDEGIARSHTPAAPSQEPGKCAQCKKPYRKGANTEGCPKCAPGVVVPESEFQKPISAQAPGMLTDEPWYGHKFKEVTRGVWHCECGKTVNEGATPCTNGTQSISTMRRDAVNVDATEMHDAGSAAHAGQGKFTRVDGSRSSLRGSGTQDDPFVADNLDDLAAAPTSPLQEPVTLTDRQFDLICQAIDKADTITMDGDYMMDSGDCIAVVRVMQALFDIAAMREKEKVK